ncbi:MAG TPA: arginine--tRNA ligase [Candidatus Edwardsbacteria bacterium]|nr:arginine--tRNA ligase [Candidatus Edwardsbacteria bacterium]
MIQDYLKTQILASLAKASGAPVDPALVGFERPKQAAHGDWSTNIAMALAKQRKENPRKLAEAILANLTLDPDLVEKAEIAGPGFINFRLSQNWLYRELENLLAAGPKYGQSKIGNGTKVQVEFVSVNPTGPLHVGHGRGAFVGDAIARLLQCAGYDVQREYYINDAGNQIDKLGRSVLARLNELWGRPFEFPEGGYQGEYLKEFALALDAEQGGRLKALPAEELLAAVTKISQEKMLAQLKSSLKDLNVEFDEWFPETSLVASGALKDSLDELQAKGYLYEQDGARFFRATEFGDEKDRVVIKSGGEHTYFAADIAYLRNKFGRGFERLIYVWGADHHGDVPRMRGAAQALGHDPDALEFILMQMVRLIEEGREVKFSKRSGVIVTLDELRDEVGPDVMRYFFLMRRSESQFDFDLDLARKHSDENPVYYVQYAHARICSILAHAVEKGVARAKGELALLMEPEEVTLIKSLLEFPELVAGAAQAREPHRIPVYLQELAGIFHAFYHKHRVVTDDLKLSNARLDLCDATRTVLANGLQLLGLSAPQKM